MSAACRGKVRLTYSREKKNAAQRKRQIPQLQTAEYRAVLLKRYPVGLIEDVELEALLKDWWPTVTLHTNRVHA